ncbi:MAG TPA: hypothetical protein VFT62_06515 [Mycobacteriales bacterium]|nr:hypothetical protein [Mycobacteriales bacterium]
MDKTVVCGALAAATVALVAGCGSGSASSGSTVTPPAAAASVHSPAAPTAVTPPASASTSASPSAAVSSAAAGSAAAGSGTGTATRSRSTQQQPGGDTVALTPPGRYRYHLAGSESSALGKRTIDGTSTLVVDPPQHGRQHTATDGADGHSEQTVLARRTGLYLADIKMSQQGFSEEFRPRSPVLLLPATARAGRSWQWQMTSTDGKYTLHATLQVTDPSGSAAVHGQRVSTVVVSSVLRITGNAITMTIHQRDEATRDGLIVQEHAVGDGTAYGTKFHTDTTRTLTSPPR